MRGFVEEDFVGHGFTILQKQTFVCEPPIYREAVQL
jgi:hypothetical protein